MTKLTDEELDRLRSIPIHSILGQANNGRRVSMCCPFHSEKTPSFVLYPDNSYHCYGCQAHGKGAIDFVVSLGYTFGEALEYLKTQ